MSSMIDAMSRVQAAQANSSIPGVGSGTSGDDLEAVAQEFESLFVKMMMDSMRDTRNTEDNFTYGGMAEDIFEDMLYTEYSKTIAQRGDFAIADMIVQQFSGASSANPSESSAEN